MPRGIAGPPCLQGSQIWRPGPPGWGLGVGLTTLPCKNYHVEKPKSNSRTDLRKQPGNKKRIMRRKQDWFLASWNVRSLFRAGALKNLTKELDRYNIMIAAIQEIRWRRSEIFDYGNYTICHSASNDRNNFGTGFLIHKKVKNHILNFKSVDERICYLRLKGKFYNTSIICAHAPTEEKEDEIKNSFYDRLDRTFQQIPKHDAVMVMGDFNAKVGQKHVTPNVGKFSLHEISNENGERLCDFAVAHNLVISSTTFPHKNIHLMTWNSPDGRTHNQIDHILISARHASSIIDVRSQRGADCDSDHFMVRVKYRPKIALFRKSDDHNNHCIKYNIDQFKDPNKINEYRQAVQLNVTELSAGTDVDVEQQWSLIKQSIQNAAENVVGTIKNKPRNQWFDSECNDAIEDRNRLRKIMLQRITRSTTEEYKITRRRAKQICRAKKRSFEESMLFDLEEKFGRNESKKFFEGIRKIQRGFIPRTKWCRDNSGNLVTDETEILNLWYDYFKNLLNKNNGSVQQTVTYFGPDLYIPAPDISEVHDIIKKLKNNRAPGDDGINPELIKYASKDLWKSIHKLIVEIWNTETMPKD